MMGLAICLRRLGNHYESLDVLRSVLPKLEYLLKVYSEEEHDVMNILSSSPKKMKRSNTVFFPAVNMCRQAQLTKFTKLTCLVFMNLSRTLEFMSKYYHSEVLARAAFHTAEDSILPNSEEFSELTAAYYSLIAGKVSCMLIAVQDVCRTV